jgi:hypothetical protein
VTARKMLRWGFRWTCLTELAGVSCVSAVLRSFVPDPADSLRFAHWMSGEKAHGPLTDMIDAVYSEANESWKRHSEMRSP